MIRRRIRECGIERRESGNCAREGREVIMEQGQLMDAMNEGNGRDH